MLTNRQEKKVLILHARGSSRAQIANAVGCGPGPVATTIRRGCTRDEWEDRVPTETTTGMHGEYLPCPAEIKRQAKVERRKALARKKDNQTPEPRDPAAARIIRMADFLAAIEADEADPP